MNHLNQFSMHWFGWIVESSWQLAFLTCIVGLACYLARNASPRLRYALWLLVLVKAFLAADLATPWSCWKLGPGADRSQDRVDGIRNRAAMRHARPPIENDEDGDEAALEIRPALRRPATRPTPMSPACRRPR